MSAKLLILLAFLIIWLPVAGFFAAGATDVSQTENRAAAAFPALSLDRSLLGFPRGFEKWWSDHLGFRQKLIDYYTTITSQWMNTPDKVVPGKDNWLFLYKTSLEPGLLSPFVDYCGRAPFSEQALNDWVAALVNNWQQLKNRGIRYQLVLIPNKHTLFAEWFPERISCTPGMRRYQQLVKELQNITEFPLLDLEPYLKDQKQTDDIWFKRDTHWNGLAATGSLDALLTVLSGEGGSFEPPAYRLITSSAESGDLITLSQLSGEPYQSTFVELTDPQAQPGKTRVPVTFPWQRYPALASDNPQANDRTLLAIHDSFFAVHEMQRLLGEVFSRAAFVRRPGHFDLDYLTALIDAEQPDIVVQQFVERKLLWPEPTLHQP